MKLNSSNSYSWMWVLLVQYSLIKVLWNDRPMVSYPSECKLFSLRLWSITRNIVACSYNTLYYEQAMGLMQFSGSVWLTVRFYVFNNLYHWKQLQLETVQSHSIMHKNPFNIDLQVTTWSHITPVVFLLRSKWKMAWLKPTNLTEMP